MNFDDQTTKLLRSMDAAPVSEIDGAHLERAQAAKALIMAENPAAQVPAGETVRGKPKRKSLTIAIAGLLAACGIAAGGTLVAVAGDDRDRTEPALSVAGDSFYPADDLDVAWASAVESYPAALPEGVEFPMGAPDFFRPTDLADGDQPVFQAGLVEGFVTTYWKCAWTEEKILSEEAGDVAASGEADRALSDVYPGLPGAMPEQPNQAEYEQGLADEAAALGITPAEVEFSRDCGFYSDTAGMN